MKILCVCRKGQVRSVGTKKVLNERGYRDVIAIGGLSVPQETLNMLCKWADVILLAKVTHGKRIDPRYTNKINTKFHIGEDLIPTVKKQLDKVGLK